MSDDMTATFDVDGGIARQEELMNEALAEQGHTRGAFLKKFAVGAGGAAIASSLLAPATSLGAQKASEAGDLTILNYALTLEFLEAAFYKEAYNRGHLNSTYRNFAKVVGDHEAQHVAAIAATIKKLGGTPVKSPKFDFGTSTGSNSAFSATSLALEETGVPAYIGQAPFILNKAVLLAAARIATIEARHASWIRTLLGKNPAPNAFDGQRTSAATLKIVKSTGFIPALG